MEHSLTQEFLQAVWNLHCAKRSINGLPTELRIIALKQKLLGGLPKFSLYSMPTGFTSLASLAQPIRLAPEYRG